MMREENDKKKQLDEMQKQGFWRQQRRSLIVLGLCLIMLLGVIPGIRKIAGIDAAPTPADTATQDSGTQSAARVPGLKTFANEQEIRDLIERAGKGGWMLLAPKEGISAVADGAAGDAEMSTAESGAGHAQTYRQVEGVDEADIIKTDGSYIYHVNGEDEIDIYRAKSGEAEKIATISQFDEDGQIDTMYLDGERLISVGAIIDRGVRKSVVTIYDITDRKKPKEMGRFEQSGTVLTSRMVDGIIYLISNDQVADERVLPYVTRGGTYGKINIADVVAFPRPSNTSYVVVSSIDCLDVGKMNTASKAVLGAATEIYCNQEHLYIACTDYAGSQPATRILKTDLNGGELVFAATGKVRGEIIGQFAMDEYEESFRIATTSERGGHDVNNLYLFDAAFNKHGSVTGFARDESIRAVRYMGDKAYVITFKETDPLFVLDLSDMDDPRIDGEVEITGFSSLLVPVAQDKLVGIGYTDGGQTGLKLALFDVSDPAKPAVLDEKEYDGRESDAQYDHHALMQNADAGYLALPYRALQEDVIIEDAEVSDEQSADEADGGISEVAMSSDKAEHGGVLVFTADEKIDVTEDHETETGVSRCVYIGHYIYAVTDTDEIIGFEYAG